jgi:GxxExxY protein
VLWGPPLGEKGELAGYCAGMPINRLTSDIPGVAIDIHRAPVGPGLLESVYQRVLPRALSDQGSPADANRQIDVVYRRIVFENAFRADLIVNALVIVEVKSLEQIAPVHRKQLLTYLCLTGMHVGLLHNFGEATMKQGMHRLVNNLSDSECLRGRR